MPRLLVYVVPIALAVYALIDLWRSRPEERGPLHPAVWALIIVLLPVVGPVAWILLSRYYRSGSTPPAPRGPRGAGPSRRPGPVAPDDDPDFLWRLEMERRRREQPGGRSGGPQDAQGDAGGADPAGGDTTGEDRPAADR